jgi:hypothetical protein
MSGRRVTMPVPRGKKSLPTMPSRTELFPALLNLKTSIQNENFITWAPITTIWGNWISLCKSPIFVVEKTAKKKFYIIIIKIQNFTLKLVDDIN